MMFVFQLLKNVKLELNNQGEVVQKIISLSARKIPFRQVRTEALTRNKDLLRIKDDDCCGMITQLWQIMAMCYFV